MKIINLAVALILAATVIIIATADTDTDGCTGFYIGPDATADGTFIIGQSADVGAFLPVNYEIHDAVYDQPGRYIKGLAGFEYQLPASTYRYSLHTSSPISVYSNTLGQYAGAGSINSMGVACTGSITGTPNDKALTADPYATKGLAEDTACAIVGACASSAREGVELLISIINTYGSKESNIFIIADQNEAWYLEIYTGHQYAAVALPENAAVFTGNEFGIQFIDSYSKSIVSPTLESFAKEKGFRVETDKKFDIEASYSAGPTEGYIDKCHIRTWRAHSLLAPSTIGGYDIKERYPLTFIPDKKVSLTDIMSIMGDRYEGTVYDADSGTDPKYPIGNYTTFECHVIQIYRDKSIPKECCCVKWQLIGKTTFGVFLPTVVGVTDMVSEFMKHDANYIVGDSAYSRTVRLYSQISEDMKSYKTEVKYYNSELQGYCVKTFPDVYKKYLETYKTSHERADKYITDYTMDLQKKYLRSLDTLNNDIAVYRAYKDTRPPDYYTFFDVADTAKRYGWQILIEGNTMTLTQSTDKVVINIEDPNDYRSGYTKAAVDVNNIHYKDIPVYKSNDSFFLQFYKFGSTITKYNPVVDVQIPPEPEPEKKEDNNATVIISVILIVCVAVIIATIFIVAKRE